MDTLVASVSYMGQMGSVGVSNLIPCETQLKISRKYPFSIWCFLCCAVLSNKREKAKPIVGDRLMRWYSGRHRFRIIQLGTDRLETTSYRKIEDTEREFKSEFILACTTLRRRFLFLVLVWHQRILVTLLLSLIRLFKRSTGQIKKWLQIVCSSKRNLGVVLNACLLW